MKKEKLNFLVMGGDERQAYLCEMLYKDGHTVTAYALERHAFEPGVSLCSDLRTSADAADAIVLPMPVSREENRLNAPLSNAVHRMDQVLQCIPPNRLVTGGAVGKVVIDLCSQYALTIVDYLQREELAVLNAIPTAEGAVQIAMEELPITLHGAHCLVIGNGRIGKILAQDLAALGAHVTVSARKSADFARIYAAGYNCADTRQLEDVINCFDVVFNTVPHMVLDDSRLRAMRPDALVIDLASKPGGVDLTAAQQMGKKVIWALSLPGKVAPVTSAAAIRDTIYNILSEGVFVHE